MRKYNALLRFYFKVNPDKLTDRKWAELVNDLLWVLEKNGTIKNDGENINFT